MRWQVSWNHATIKTSAILLANSNNPVPIDNDVMMMSSSPFQWPPVIHPTVGIPPLGSVTPSHSSLELSHCHSTLVRDDFPPGEMTPQRVNQPSAVISHPFTIQSRWKVVRRPIFGNRSTKGLHVGPSLFVSKAFLIRLYLVAKGWLSQSYMRASAGTSDSSKHLHSRFAWHVNSILVLVSFRDYG